MTPIVQKCNYFCFDITDSVHKKYNFTTKEAFGAFKIVSQYIEQSSEYNDQKLELLAKVDDCLFEINQSYLKQKRINEYFKKITSNPGADYLKKT